LGATCSTWLADELIWTDGCGFCCGVIREAWTWVAFGGSLTAIEKTLAGFVCRLLEEKQQACP